MTIQTVSVSLLIASSVAAAAPNIYLHGSSGVFYSGVLGDSNVELIGNTGLGSSAGSLTSASNGKLYATGHIQSPTGTGWIEVDRATGAQIGSGLLSPSGFGIQAFDFDLDGNAVVWDFNGADILVIRQDAVTGDVLSEVAIQGPQHSRFGWAVRSDGLLLGASNRVGVFDLIDPLTGEVTSLGVDTPGDVFGWDTWNGRTFFGTRPHPGAFDIYEIDPFTGGFALVSSIDFGDNPLSGTIFGLAVNPTPGTLAPVAAGVVLAARRRR